MRPENCLNALLLIRNDWLVGVISTKQDSFMNKASSLVAHIQGRPKNPGLFQIMHQSTGEPRLCTQSASVSRCVLADWAALSHGGVKGSDSCISETPDQHLCSYLLLP